MATPTGNAVGTWSGDVVHFSGGLDVKYLTNAFVKSVTADGLVTLQQSSADWVAANTTGVESTPAAPSHGDTIHYTTAQTGLTNHVETDFSTAITEVEANAGYAFTYNFLLAKWVKYLGLCPEITIQLNIPKIWTGTKAEYDALASKDATTLYFYPGGIALGTIPIANLGTAGVADLAAAAAFAGGTEALAATVSDSVVDAQVAAAFVGGTEALAAAVSTSVVASQVVAAFVGGTEAMAAAVSTSVVNAQVAAALTGGTEAVAATVSTSVIDAQVAAAFAGGTEALAATVTTTADAQVAAAFAGGTENTIAIVSVVTVTHKLTFNLKVRTHLNVSAALTGGTEALAATVSDSVVDSQVAAAFTGGTEALTAPLTDYSLEISVAAAFAGGTEAVAATVSTSQADLQVAVALAGGTEAVTAPVSLTPLTPVLTATTATSASGGVDLSATDARDESDGYNYRYRKSGETWGSWTWIGNNADPWPVNINGLEAGATYEFQVESYITGQPASFKRQSNVATAIAGAGTQSVAAAFAGGTEAVAATLSTLANVPATAAFAGGTEALAVTVSTSVVDSQVAAAFTGGTEALTAPVSIFAASLGVAAAFTGGTEAVALTLTANAPTVPATFDMSAVIVTSYDGGILLDWLNAIPDNGGKPITDYVLHYQIPGSSSWTNVSVNNVTRMHVSGLTNGTPYNFRLAAINSVGSSLWPSILASGTPDAAVPNPDQAALTAVPGSAAGHINLTWVDTRPDRAGYNYRTRQSGGSWGSWTWIGASHTSSPPTTYAAHTITGLTAGQEYEVQLQSYGGSPSQAILSTVATVTVASHPPAQVAAAFAGGTEALAATVTAIAHAQVSAAFAGGTEALTAPVSTSSTDAQVAAAFAGGTEALTAPVSIFAASLGVAAAFTGGTEAVALTLTANAPTVPATFDMSAVIVTSYDGGILLDWLNAIPDNGGKPITDYVLHYQIPGSSSWTNVSVNNVTRMHVSGLTNGTPYNFRLAAINSVGSSLWPSILASGTPDAAVPNPDQAALTAVPGSAAGHINLTWVDTRPDRAGYNYRTRQSGGSWGSWTWIGASHTSSPPTTYAAHTITGLTAGQEYEVQLQSYGGSPNQSVLSTIATAIAAS